MKDEDVKFVLKAMGQAIIDISTKQALFAALLAKQLPGLSVEDRERLQESGELDLKSLEPLKAAIKLLQV